MKLKLSPELRNKLKNISDLKITQSPNTMMSGGMIFKTPGIDNITLTVYFTAEEQDLFKEAVEWEKHISNYFQTSYETYKVNIGRLEGVFPIGVESTCEGTQVEFSIDNIKPESWKDWFIQEGV